MEGLFKLQKQNRGPLSMMRNFDAEALCHGSQYCNHDRPHRHPALSGMVAAQAEAPLPLHLGILPASVWPQDSTATHKTQAPSQYYMQSQPAASQSSPLSTARADLPVRGVVAADVHAARQAQRGGIGLIARSQEFSQLSVHACVAVSQDALCIWHMIL